MIDQYYGDIHTVHLIMGVFGNLISILWGAWGAWNKLEDKSLFRWAQYASQNRNRIFFGVLFTVAIFAVVPVIIEEMMPGVEFSPLVALSFSLFPITAMTNIMKKAESKIK